jgi:hypothetical protein
VDVAEGVTGEGVSVNVGGFVGVLLGIGVIEGMNTSVTAPASGAQVVKRRIINNTNKFFIVRLDKYPSPTFDL